MQSCYTFKNGFEHLERIWSKHLHKLNSINLAGDTDDPTDADTISSLNNISTCHTGTCPLDSN